MVYSAHLWGRLILSHQFLITYSSSITDGVWYNSPNLHWHVNWCYYSGSCSSSFNRVVSLAYLEDTVLVFRLSEYSAFSSAMFPKP